MSGALLSVGSVVVDAVGVGSGVLLLVAGGVTVVLGVGGVVVVVVVVGGIAVFDGVPVAVFGGGVDVVDGVPVAVDVEDCVGALTVVVLEFSVELVSEPSESVAQAHVSRASAGQEIC